MPAPARHGMHEQRNELRATRGRRSANDRVVTADVDAQGRDVVPTSRVSEREMEDAIAADPERWLGAGLTLEARQKKLGSVRPDLQLLDGQGALVLVELQAGTLDREHIARALDYRTLAARRTAGHIRVVVVANQIHEADALALRENGIECTAIPAEEFRRQPWAATRVRELTVQRLLDQLGEHGRSNPGAADGLAFWVRTWSDRSMDHLIMTGFDLRSLENAGRIFYNDTAGRPRVLDSSGIPRELPGVPAQIVAEAGPLLALTVEQAFTAFAWFDLLLATQPRHRRDHAITFGGPLEAAHTALARRYLTASANGPVYDPRAIRRDAEAAASLALVLGRAPSYRCARFCGGIQVEAANLPDGAAGAIVRFEDVRIDYVLVMRELLDHLLNHHLPDCSAQARRFSRETLLHDWHQRRACRPGSPLACRLDLARQCSACLRAPRRLGSIPAAALRNAERYFANMRP